MIVGVARVGDKCRAARRFRGGHRQAPGRDEVEAQGRCIVAAAVAAGAAVNGAVIGAVIDAIIGSGTVAGANAGACAGRER